MKQTLAHICVLQGKKMAYVDDKFLFVPTDGIELECGGRRAVAVGKRAHCVFEILMTDNIHTFWLLASTGTIIGVASRDNPGLGQTMQEDGLIVVEVNAKARTIRFTSPDLKTTPALDLQGDGPLQLIVRMNYKGGHVEALAHSCV